MDSKVALLMVSIVDAVALGSFWYFVFFPPEGPAPGHF